MERVIFDNVSKQFLIGFERKKSALARIISLIFGRVSTKLITAVDNVSFKVQSGEIVGIIGKNGSGKSTLLRLVAKIYKPNSGNILTNGKVISLINLNIGLKPRLTMKDNIFLIGSLFDLGMSDIKQRFDDIVNFAELKEFTNTKLSQFSSGMAQRLVFSIAIHANPKILLLDEVFEVGDESFKKKSSAKIKQIAEEGACVLLVSHDLDMVRKHCTSAILMKEGKISKQGSAKEIISEYSLS